jgi:tetratricopeptide (TPR) repeat protein
MTGLTLSRNRDWLTSEALWSDTVRKAPRCGRALLNLAIVHGERGELDEAEPLLRRSLEATDIPRARAYLGDLLSRRGRLGEADRTLRAAYERYPQDRFVVKFHAMNLLRMDRHDEARGILEKGIATWPGDPDLHYLLGGCHLMAGRPVDALEQNLEVLRRRPGDAAARKIAVEIARKLGRADLARRLEDGWTPE